MSRLYNDFMMLFLSLALATTFIKLTIAQSTTQSTDDTPPTKSVATATHTVSVGANGHHFEPSQTNADVGDIMEFFFYPQNHSVARANFGQPCIPYEITGPGRIGFWSGFMPVQVVLSRPPSFQVRVNDTEPIFYYCSAPGACFDGMVGVINPNSTQNFATQHEFSQNATQEFSPGETYFEPEVGSTRTRGPSTPTSTSGIPGGSLVEADHPHGLSTGLVSGIVIAAVFAVVIAAAVIYICGRQKTINEIMHRQAAAPNPSPVYHPDLPGYAEAQYPNMKKLPMRMRSSSSGPYSETPYDFGVAATDEGPPVDERSCVIRNPSGFASPRRDGATPLSSPGYSLYDSYRENGNQEPLTQLPPHRPPHPLDNFGPVELPATSAPSHSYST